MQNAGKAKKLTLQGREKRFAYEAAEATKCGRGCITVCDLALLQTSWLSFPPNQGTLDRMIRVANSANVRLRAALKPYGYTVKHVARGSWSWEQLQGIVGSNGQVPMAIEADLMKTAQTALKVKDYAKAADLASAAIALYEESYRAHRLVTICGLLHHVQIPLGNLTTSARFIHDHDLLVQKAIRFFRLLVDVNPHDKATAMVTAQIEVFEVERGRDRQLMQAIEQFLNKRPLQGRSAGCMNGGVYDSKIACVFNAPVQVGGRMPEIKTILAQPDLNLVVHRIADRVAGDDPNARRQVQEVAGRALARLIKAFKESPTLDQILRVPEEQFEGLIIDEMSGHPDDREKNTRGYLPDHVERDHDGRYREIRNPRNRLRRKRDEY